MLVRANGPRLGTDEFHGGAAGVRWTRPRRLTPLSWTWTSCAAQSVRNVSLWVASSPKRWDKSRSVGSGPASACSAPSARNILVTAALAGFVTAMPASEPAAHDRRNYPRPHGRRGVNRMIGNRWLPVACTCAALVLLWLLGVELPEKLESPEKRGKEPR
jgi:hypothetical protein